MDGDKTLEFPLVPQVLAGFLRDAIVFCELQPGARVTEEEIAERYRVSRSPVREALRFLQAEGLVVREERRGVRISAVNRRDMDDVYRCRIPLEGLAAGDAAERRTEAQMAQLAQRLEQLEDAFASHDIRRYFTANVAFSSAIHAAADNNTVRRLLDGIGKQALRYRFLAYSSVPQLMDVSVESHRDLLDMIRRREAERARRLTENLIERSWKTLRDCVAE